MTTQGSMVLILGSSPSVAAAAKWPKAENLLIVAINNAWRVRSDWDHLIHAGDFPPERRPQQVSFRQKVHSYQAYVPSQNRFGGFVYAGGTMAFTAGYWALDALKADVLAYAGCDMVYRGTNTHFYGAGTPDPLRDDVTLRSLEAKSARLMAFAARQGCACVNLSAESESRLIFPKASIDDLSRPVPVPSVNARKMEAALAEEKRLGYFIEDGEYWRHMHSFDGDALAGIDAQWLEAVFMDQTVPELV